MLIIFKTTTMKARGRLNALLSNVSSSRLLLLLGGVLLVTGAIAYNPLFRNNKTSIPKSSDVTFVAINKDVCAGETSVGLGDITIDEGLDNDFVAGKGTLVLSFDDPNFKFTGSPSATITGTGASGSTISVVSSPDMTDGKIYLSFNFSTGSEGASQSINITGLQVNTTALANGSADIKVAGDLGNVVGLDVTKTLGTVNVTNPAAAAKIEGLNAVYHGETVTFSVPAITGADAYEWTLTGSTGAFMLASANDNERTIEYTVTNSTLTPITASLKVRGVNNSGACKGAYSEVHDITIYDPNNTSTVDPVDPDVNLTIPHTRKCVEATGPTGVDVGTIVITERMDDDFNNTVTGTAALFPSNPNFAFVENVSALVIQINGSDAGISNIQFEDQTVDGTPLRQLSFDYDLTGLSDAAQDQITISGLEVSTASTTTETTNILIRDMEGPLGLTFKTVLARATVQALPTGTGAITGPSNLAIGETKTFTVTGITGTSTYQWEVPAGFVEEGTVVTSTGSIALTANSETAPIDITVKGISNDLIPGCESASVTHSVTIGKPVEITTPVPIDLCYGQSILLGDIVITEIAQDGIVENNGNRSISLKLPPSLEFDTDMVPQVNSTTDKSGVTTVFDVSGKRFLDVGDGNREFKFNIKFPSAFNDSKEIITISDIKVKTNSRVPFAAAAAALTITGNGVDHIRGLQRDAELVTINIKETPNDPEFVANTTATVCNNNQDITLQLKVDGTYEWETEPVIMGGTPLILGAATTTVKTNTLRAPNTIVAGTEHIIRVRQTNADCESGWVTHTITVQDATPDDISAGNIVGPTQIFQGSTSNVFNLNITTPTTNIAEYKWEWFETGSSGTPPFRNTTIPVLDLSASGLPLNTDITLRVTGVSGCGEEGTTYVNFTFQVVETGVVLVAPTDINDMCAGDSEEWGPIVLTERNAGAFRMGGGTINLELSDKANFELEDVKPTVSLSNPGSSTVTGMIHTSGATNVLQITYNFDAASENVINSISISGVRVKVLSAATALSAKLEPTNIGVGANDDLTGIDNSKTFATANAKASPPLATFTAGTVDNNLANICRGTVDISGTKPSYEVTDVPGAKYHWTLPTGFTITSADPENSNKIEIETGVNAVSGQVEVRLEIGGCVGEAAMLNVTVPVVDDAGGIFGPGDLCAQDNPTYFVPSIDGSNGYKWVFKNGATVLKEYTTADGDNQLPINVQDLFDDYDVANPGNTATVLNLLLTVEGINTGTCANGNPSPDLPVKVSRVRLAITTSDFMSTGSTSYNSDDPEVALIAQSNGTNVSTSATFSGPGVRQDISGTYFFDPSKVSAGEHVVQCTYTEPTAACRGTATITFTVAVVNSLGLVENYCKDDAVIHPFTVSRVITRDESNPNVRIVTLVRDLKRIDGVAGSGPFDDMPNSLPTLYSGVTDQTFSYTFQASATNPLATSIEIIANEVTATYLLESKPFPGAPDVFRLSGSTVISKSQTDNPINIIKVETPVVNVPSTTLCADNKEHDYFVSAPNGDYEWKIVPESAGDFIGGRTGNRVTIRWKEAGNHQLTVQNTRLTDGVSCQSNVETVSVEVQALPTVDFSPKVAMVNSVPEICQGATETYTSDATLNSYRWVVTNGIISGRNDGQSVNVIWTGVGSGTIALTGTNGFGCALTTTRTINIIRAVDFDSSSDLLVCENQTGATYAIKGASEGTLAWEVIDSDGMPITPTIVDGRSIEVAWGSAGKGKVTVTETIGAGCSTTKSLEVDIISLPEVSITMDLVYCESLDEAMITPNVVGLSTFDKTKGEYILHKVAADGTESLVTNPTRFLETKADDMPDVLKVKSLNDDPTDGSATAASYKLSYKFSNGAGCENTSPPIEFKIVSQPDVNFSIDNTQYCKNTPTMLVTLTDGTATTGTIEVRTISGVVGSPISIVAGTNPQIVDISALPAGNYNLRYTRNIGIGCDNFNEEPFEILPEPTLTLTPDLTEVCIGSITPIQLTAVVNENIPGSTPSSAIKYEVRRKGMPETAYEVITDKFNPMQPLPSQVGTPTTAVDWNMWAGIYEVRFKYTTSSVGSINGVDAKNACEYASPPIEIEVKPLPELSFEGLSTGYCAENVTVKLTPKVGMVEVSETDKMKADNEFIITKPDGTKEKTNDRFNPSLLGEGNFSIVYTFRADNGCPDTSAAQTFSIKKLPQIAFGLKDLPNGSKFCISADSITFDPVTSGGVFSVQKDETGAPKQVVTTGNVLKISDLLGDDVDKLGTYNVFYEFDDAGCIGTFPVNGLFEIVPLPVVSIININKDGYCTELTDPFQLEISLNSGTVPDINADTANTFLEIRRASGKRAATDFTKLRVPNSKTLTDMFDPRRPISRYPFVQSHLVSPFEST